MIITRLYDLRKRLHLAQSEVARRMSLTQGAVSKIEHRSIDNVQWDTLRRYCNAVGVEMSAFIQLPNGSVLNLGGDNAES